MGSVQLSDTSDTIPCADPLILIQVVLPGLGSPVLAPLRLFEVPGRVSQPGPLPEKQRLDQPPSRSCPELLLPPRGFPLPL